METGEKPRPMSFALWYRSDDVNCTALRQFIAQRVGPAKPIHFVCLDSVRRAQDGRAYAIITGASEPVLIPKAVTSVPALTSLTDRDGLKGRTWLGDDIYPFLVPGSSGEAWRVAARSSASSAAVAHHHPARPAHPAHQQEEAGPDSFTFGASYTGTFGMIDGEQPMSHLVTDTHACERLAPPMAATDVESLRGSTRMSDDEASKRMQEMKSDFTSYSAY